MLMLSEPPSILKGPQHDRHRSPTQNPAHRNGASQAVRIPKDLAFSEDIEVEVIRQGDEVIVRPAHRRLTGLGAALRQMGSAMQGFEREQTEHQERIWPKPRDRR